MVCLSASMAAHRASIEAGHDETASYFISRLTWCNLSNTHDAAVVTSGDIECGCCFSDVPVTEATSMECGHAYCNDCWHQHFKVQISEGNSRRLLCMAVKCGAICDDRQVLSSSCCKHVVKQVGVFAACLYTIALLQNRVDFAARYHLL